MSRRTTLATQANTHVQLIVNPLSSTSRPARRWRQLSLALLGVAALGCGDKKAVELADPAGGQAVGAAAPVVTVTAPTGSPTAVAAPSAQAVAQAPAQAVAVGAAPTAVAQPVQPVQPGKVVNIAHVGNVVEIPAVAGQAPAAADLAAAAPTAAKPKKAPAKPPRKEIIIPPSKAPPIPEGLSEASAEPTLIKPHHLNPIRDRVPVVEVRHHVTWAYKSHASVGQTGVCKIENAAVLAPVGNYVTYKTPERVKAGFKGADRGIGKVVMQAISPGETNVTCTAAFRGKTEREESFKVTVKVPKPAKK